MATQYLTATSLDGYVAGPGDDLGWLDETHEAEGEAGPDGEDRFGTFFAGVGAMVMGASTYAWVHRVAGITDAEAWAALYGDVPCWVLTHRDLPPLPTVTFAAGDVAEVHARMVTAAGDRNVWVVGGGDVAGQFADAGLLDEIHLSVAPVTLGAGAPLLPRRLGPDRLTLTGVERADPFVRLTYRVHPLRK